MQHVMIDLETMGQGPRAAVASIGAVVFELYEEDTVESIGPSRRFYSPINLCKQKTREFDPSTIYWWMIQSPEARAAICAGEGGVSGDPYTQLSRLVSFIEGHGAKTSWCLGATFDHPILDSLFKDCGIKNPLHYSKQLCLRTLGKLASIPRPNLPELVGHNALDDCIRQVIWMQQSLKAITDDGWKPW